MGPRVSNQYPGHVAIKVNRLGAGYGRSVPVPFNVAPTHINVIITIFLAEAGVLRESDLTARTGYLALFINRFFVAASTFGSRQNVAAKLIAESAEC